MVQTVYPGIPNDGIPNYCISKITFGIPKQTTEIPNCGIPNYGIPNNRYITDVIARYQNIITFLLTLYIAVHYRQKHLGETAEAELEILQTSTGLQATRKPRNKVIKQN